MQRRDFLKHAAVVGGVVVVGVPKVPVGDDATVEETNQPNYTLFGVKPYGCALSRSFHYQSDPLPENLARLIS